MGPRVDPGRGPLRREKEVRHRPRLRWTDRGSSSIVYASRKAARNPTFEGMDTPRGKRLGMIEHTGATFSGPFGKARSPGTPRRLRRPNFLFSPIRESCGPHRSKTGGSLQDRPSDSEIRWQPSLGGAVGRSSRPARGTAPRPPFGCSRVFRGGRSPTRVIEQGVGGLARDRLGMPSAFGMGSDLPRRAGSPSQDADVARLGWTAPRTAADSPSRSEGRTHPTVPRTPPPSPDPDRYEAGSEWASGRRGLASTHVNFRSMAASAGPDSGQRARGRETRRRIAPR